MRRTLSRCESRMPLRRAQKLVAAAASIAMLALPSPASADTVRSVFYRDGNDTSREMDIRVVGLVTRNDPRTYTLTIHTFEPIQMPEDGELWVRLDAFGAHRWDYQLHIWYDAGSSGVYCDTSFRKGNKNPYPIRWDVSGRSAWCRFNDIRHDKPIRFRTWSIAHEGGLVIIDRAPDGGGWYP
jgi:hypothetical protein